MCWTWLNIWKGLQLHSILERLAEFADHAFHQALVSGTLCHKINGYTIEGALISSLTLSTELAPVSLTLSTELAPISLTLSTQFE